MGVIYEKKSLNKITLTYILRQFTMMAFNPIDCNSKIYIEGRFRKR